MKLEEILTEKSKKEVSLYIPIYLSAGESLKKVYDWYNWVKFSNWSNWYNSKSRKDDKVKVYVKKIVLKYGRN